MIDEIKHAAKGNWKSILVSFGIPEEQLNGKEQSCLFCGGKTRARWIEAKEYYFCSHCDSRSRDGFQMIMEYNNMTFPAVKNELADLLGIKKQVASSDKMKKIRHEQRTAKYLKAVRYVILASNHLQLKNVTGFTDKEIYWVVKANQFVLAYRNDNKNYLQEVGI